MRAGAFWYANKDQKRPVPLPGPEAASEETQKLRAFSQTDHLHPITCGNGDISPGGTVMNVETALNELNEIRDSAQQGQDIGEDDRHKRLFELFVAIEKALPRQDGGNPAIETKADALTQTQCDIIYAAARLEAHLIREVLFKLALWRWMAPELDQPVENMQPCDAIAYSAFRDLAKILGEESTLNEFDLAC